MEEEDKLDDDMGSLGLTNPNMSKKAKLPERPFEESKLNVLDRPPSKSEPQP